MLRYSGGTVNRWLIEKISNNATQMSGATSFQDYLNGLLANAEDMTLGTGNAGMRISGSSDVTIVGDWDSISTGTRTIWDDFNQSIKTFMNEGATSVMEVIERGNDYKLDQIVNASGFVDRQRQIASKALFTDKITGGDTFANDTVLFEVRTGNDGSGTYRGMLIPSMSSSAAAGIVAVGPADYLLYHDVDCRMSFQFDNNQAVWRSVGNYSGTYSNSVSSQTTFSVTFPSATMPDTSYRVLVTAQNALSATDFYVINKTTTGFDIESINGLTGDVLWDWLVTY
jgi:hypothetical protein